MYAHKSYLIDVDPPRLSDTRQIQTPGKYTKKNGRNLLFATMKATSSIICI